MKKTTLFLCLALVLGLAAGCAQKSESEKLRDDMNKAGKKLSSDMKGFAN